MHARTRTRTWRRAVIPAAVVAVALFAGGLVRTQKAHGIDIYNWTINHSSILLNKAQEGDDEVYIAVIQFRSTPGVRGSTKASFKGVIAGGLRELKLNSTHQTVSVPPEMGKVTFSNVRRVGEANLEAGDMPELIGTVTVLFESDSTPFSTVKSGMVDAAAVAQREIANVVEPLTFADLTNPKAVAEKVKGAAKTISSGTRKSILSKIGTWLASGTDPDDKIDSKIELYAALDSPKILGFDVGKTLSSAMTPAEGKAGILDNDYNVLEYNGDGGRYGVVTVVSKS